MTVAVVQHVDFEGPGLIGRALADRNVEVRIARMDLGEPLPELGQIHALVVMGGPMGALDDADYPYLADERRLIADCVETNRPVLGVCLGAQLLAAALGAPVYRGSQLEVGTGTVLFTDEAQADPLFSSLPRALPVLHWHHDTFDLPARARLLAVSDRCRQAFRIGASYGLQFHIELDAASLDRVRPHMPPEVVVDPAQAGSAARWGQQIFSRWADLVAR